MSRQRSLEQKRAAEAWSRVRQIQEHGKKYAKEYAQLAKSAPADIQTNGLGQTLAFWRAKGKDEHKALFHDVSGWVGNQVSHGQKSDLLEWIVNEASTDDYRRATAEAIAFLAWLKRFAEAELGG
ncbi:MAG: type III-B CRISPR module-associated protein Cmr5 [Anaerolineae bacterium]|nr:type III-B CRISPR module-associated protein Cmr5 [Anaerolineae bacterium]